MNTKISFYSVAAIILAACTQMENPVESSVPVSLSYSTIASTETKAAQNLNESTFDSGESIKVRIRNTGEGSWTDYDYTTGSAGAMSPAGSVPYYPAGEQNIDIVAYYPADADVSFTVATNQTSDASYKASDLMFASVSDQAKQDEAVNLAFSHKMAKLNVNITAGQGVSGINSLSLLNIKPTASFNQATGEVGSASGDATSIAISNNGAAVIPAQTIDGGLLSIGTTQGTATYSVASKEFDAGKLYTINITVNLRAVGTTTAITGWTSEGSVTVNPYAKEIETPNTVPTYVEAIDMGHPRGVKWANMNVGATTVTGYGDYFAWGETRPHYIDHDAYGNYTTGHWIDGKTAYNWANYSVTTIYNDGSQLELVDDAAHANWGGNWRMPTREEWIWLCDDDNRGDITWEWQNNYNNTSVQGMLVTSKITNNSIFLPAAGYWDGINHDGDTFSYYFQDWDFNGRSGLYWASTTNGSNSGRGCFFHDPQDILSVLPVFSPWSFSDYRCNGLSVRAVMD